MNGITGEQPDAVRAGVVDLAQDLTRLAQHFTSQAQHFSGRLLADHHDGQHQHRDPDQQLDSIPSAHSNLAQSLHVELCINESSY